MGTAELATEFVPATLLEVTGSYIAEDTLAVAFNVASEVGLTTTWKPAFAALLRLVSVQVTEAFA